MSDLCQCGEVKTTPRARGRTRAPRALVCLPCWRRTPRPLRRAFSLTKRDTQDRRHAIREILEWLRSNPKK